MAISSASTRESREAQARGTLSVGDHRIVDLGEGVLAERRAVADTLDLEDDEREALEHVAALVRILRSERFCDVAQPEQQLAGRFIIGRLALYRIAEFAEDGDGD